MKDKNLHLIWKAEGYLDAQLIKNYLESFGIEVFDFEESVGKSYGLTTGPLSEVELYVRKEHSQEAEEYMQRYMEAKPGEEDS
jgi:hypothetical protein